MAELCCTQHCRTAKPVHTCSTASRSCFVIKTVPDDSFVSFCFSGAICSNNVLYNRLLIKGCYLAADSSVSSSGACMLAIEAWYILTMQSSVCPWHSAQLHVLHMQLQRRHADQDADRPVECQVHACDVVTKEVPVSHLICQVSFLLEQFFQCECGVHSLQLCTPSAVSKPCMLSTERKHDT